MEAATGFEPVIKVLQTLALPLGYAANIVWSGRRGSNSRPPPWQGGVLPLNYFRLYIELKMRVKGLEPPRHKTLDPKSSASANSATPACEYKW